ncbi:MAG TPA: hypothetical protein VHZ95_05215, partial [Polyangiales bacterium]|nr:hypothetical protein [Polyangiales bacterium]
MDPELQRLSSGPARESIRPQAQRPELPKRIGILNDYVRVPYANGSSFASQFLFREFGARGHIV